ncbi:MAG: hydrolase 76 protein [Sclerophora amabilis]|nr:MAG: hydrolase 76 protein [Sclerophora amabilis]
MLPFRSTSGRCVALVAALLQVVGGVILDVDDPASIKNATRIVARGLMDYYKGNESGGAMVGLLPMPYYWWESGAMWGAMVDYYRFTNDSTYNNVTTEGLLSQIGPADDFMVPAQRTTEGNDDQAFWGFAAMSAAEQDYEPTPSGTPSWLQLVINLWNTQVPRWDTSSCGGGFKWQIFKENKGYNYKNSISNGAFFLLAARLARYTGNQTYVDWAEKSWDWSSEIGLIDKDYSVFDGADDKLNCSSLDHTEYSYNNAVYLYGAAVLYNYTNGSSIWEERTTGMLNASALFFDPYRNATNIMYESACEETSTCNTDAQSFKAYLSRFMWATTQVAPYTQSAITTLLRTSAKGAAASCSGGKDRVSCGSRWYTGSWDSLFGVGQQLSALEVMQGLLINSTAPPKTGDNVYLAQARASASPVPLPSPTSTRTAPTSSQTSGGELGRRVAAGSLLGACLALSMGAIA